jgi:hypothetical protein
MAVGTATAATLAAVGTGIGIATSAGTTAMSFAQAGNQRKLQRKAEREAAEAMDAARKKLDVNFYEQLAIQKEPYELEREALLSAGAQAIEAGKESERGAAATAGRIYMGQQEGQRQIAGAMGQELSGLEKATAAEESRLAGLQSNLDLAQAKGAQLAARDAQEAANLATTQGMAGVVNVGQQVAKALPLYFKTPGARQLSNLESDYNKAVEAGTLSGQFRDLKGNILPFQQALGRMGGFGIDMSKVSGMTTSQFTDYMSGQNVSILKNMGKAGFEGTYVKPFSIDPFKISSFEEQMFPQ